MDAITQVLNAIEQGDPHAASQLLPLVYDELRKLAAEKMANERPGQTLEATALVHEAYLRLVGNGAEPHFNSRGHFLAAAAQAMRNILVDNARRKRRPKHGVGDRGGTGARLAEGLLQWGQRCVLAVPGTEFIQVSDHTYQLDPAEPEHFRKLWQLQSEGQRPWRGVVHLWSLDMPAPSDLALDGLNSPLYVRKRAQALADILFARLLFQKEGFADSPATALRHLLKTDDGRKALRIGLYSNKKTKIGSSMMDIIVCGAIPPYSELLGGKLVAMLMASPQVVREYREVYGKQPGQIASRLAGSPVVRPADLVFLTTTSLYHVGSSQYERLRIPGPRRKEISFEHLGKTEGYGSTVARNLSAAGSFSTRGSSPSSVILGATRERECLRVGIESGPHVRRKRDWRYSLLLPRVVGLNQQCIQARNVALVLAQQSDATKLVLRKPQKTRDFWPGLQIPPVP
jgi:hypothetical protein